MTTTIDPRIRARRVAVARASGRRRLYKFLVLAAVLAAGGLAYSLSQSALLDIDEVRLETTGSRVDAALVSDALEIESGTPLVEADLGRYEAQLEALPWVADASVRRDWPGAIVVELTERTPVAATLAGPDMWVVVDREGRVLDHVDAPPPGLLAITGIHTAGPPGSTLDDAAAPLLELTGLIDPALVPGLRGAWLEGDVVVLGMRTGERIVLGTADDLPRKLAAAMAVLDRVGGRTGWELDVAVPSAPVLRGGT